LGMDKNTEFVLWFDQLGIEDVPLVGGKNASLGEMYRMLPQKESGFQTACGNSIRLPLPSEKTGAKEKIKEILKDLNTSDMITLQTTATGSGHS
jgi:pyruvate,water dikinase